MNFAGSPDYETKRMLCFFLLPALILYAGFFILPAFYAFYISFFQWDGAGGEMVFRGVRNYIELFGDKFLWKKAVVNSLRILVLGGALIFIIAFLVSGTLSAGIFGKGFFRAVIYIPAIINPVAVAIMWKLIYNSNWGIINTMIRLLGFPDFDFAWTGRAFLPYAIIITLVWMYSGFYTIIITSALERIPNFYSEAAQMEGASEFKIFFLIKLPLIAGTLRTVVVFWFLSAIKEFSLLYAWSGAGTAPPVAAQNMATYIYMMAFGKRSVIFRMGYATAIGVIMFLFVILFITVVSKVIRMGRYEY